jgi:hypothetical protein
MMADAAFNNGGIRAVVHWRRALRRTLNVHRRKTRQFTLRSCERHRQPLPAGDICHRRHELRVKLHFAGPDDIEKSTRSDQDRPVTRDVKPKVAQVPR